MSYGTIPAHNFPLYVNTGTEQTPVWTEVGGINTITFSPSKKEADTSTFANAGWDSSMILSRGLTVTAAGHAMYDASGVKDPGQVACEAFATEVGVAARGQFQIRTPGSKAYEFSGDVSVTPFGGGVAAVASWSIDIKVSAEYEVVTVA